MANTNLAKMEKGNGVTQPELTRSGATYTPRVDIVETPEELLLFADLPGVKQEDLDVRFENGELTLHGKCAPRHEGRNFLAGEFEVGDFYRVFSLDNQSIDSQRISGELKQGVLTLHLPKSETVKPRRITVKGE
jgi:HSP20 family protein